MLRRLRENGPGLLVPLAWTFVTAAHLEAVMTRTLFVAHVVMSVIIAAFTVLSWRDMQAGILRVWKGVMLVGLPVTLAGTVGLAVTPTADALLAVSIFGWMLLPAAALGYTGRHVGRSPRVYFAGAALSVLGALVYATASVTPRPGLAEIVGLSLVTVGQTAGILIAVSDY